MMPMIYILLSLILCALNVYSMNSCYIAGKHTYLLLAVVALLCFGCDVYIFTSFGREVLLDVMFFANAVPYFLLYLLVTRKTVSLTFFNFWLWVNFFSVITNFSMFLSDITFRSYHFENVLRITLFFAYFVLYNKLLKQHHRHILEIPNVNWWLFSTVPLFFTILIVITNKSANVPEGFSRNYFMLLVIFVLMLVVYALIIYTFRKVNDLAESEFEKVIYSQQLDAAKAQIEFLNKAQMQTAIHRHDMRHNLTAIDAMLSQNHIQQARDYIKEVEGGIASLSFRHFCDNNLVDLLCSAFFDKAERGGVRLSVDANLPQELKISDMELCAILSNGLENALDAVAAFPDSDRWIELYCGVRIRKLLIEIRNPYHGEITMHDGLPVSGQSEHGYGCRSIRSIVEQRGGLCTFETEHGVFTLRVMIPLTNGS